MIVCCRPFGLVYQNFHRILPTQAICSFWWPLYSHRYCNIRFFSIKVSSCDDIFPFNIIVRGNSISFKSQPTSSVGMSVGVTILDFVAKTKTCMNNKFPERPMLINIQSGNRIRPALSDVFRLMIVMFMLILTCYVKFISYLVSIIEKRTSSIWHWTTIHLNSRSAICITILVPNSSSSSCIIK